MASTKKVKIDVEEVTGAGNVYYVVFRNEVTGHETVDHFAFGFDRHALSYHKKAIIGDWVEIPGFGYRGIARDSNYTHVCIRTLIFLGPRDIEPIGSLNQDEEEQE